MTGLARSLHPVIVMDGRAHPAEAGKARTTKVERHRDQRHLARRSGGGKGHAIEITTDRAGNGNIIGEQQINLIRREATIREIATDTDGDLAKNIPVRMCLAPFMPDEHVPQPRPFGLVCWRQVWVGYPFRHQTALSRARCRSF